MLVVKAMRTVPRQNMCSHLGHIPKSYRRELVLGPNGQRELSFMLSLRGVKQEVLRIEASTDDIVNAQRLSNKLN